MFHHLAHGPVALQILLISHLPEQNLADSGTAKIKVNPPKVYELKEHPVFKRKIFRHSMQEAICLYGLLDLHVRYYEKSSPLVPPPLWLL